LAWVAGAASILPGFADTFGAKVGLGAKVGPVVPGDFGGVTLPVSPRVGYDSELNRCWAGAAGGGDNNAPAGI
jgi:hypothetical protein